MQFIFNFVAAAAGIYSILIFFRIIFTWFGKAVPGKPIQFIGSLTDPYLDWWRKNLNLQIGIFDISPIIAISVLSVVQSIFSTLARFNRITLGNILAVVLISIWSVVSFIIGFCLIVMILRLIAFISKRNMYSAFWKAVDSISQPILYRINRIIFGNRLTNFLNGIIITLLALAVIRIGGGFIIPLFAGMLNKLPF